MSDVLEAARRHDDAFNAKDAEARVASMTPDTEVVMPGMALRGPDEAMAAVRVFWEAIPDATITRDIEVASGSLAFVEGYMTGTHSGPFQTPQGPIPPTGNQIRMRYAAVKQIEGGKVASERLYFDRLELMEQLGAMP
jgi:ketosteroid isomerase-like protein